MKSHSPTDNLLPAPSPARDRSLETPLLQYARTRDGVNVGYFSLGAGPPIVFASDIWGDVQLYSLPGPPSTYEMTNRLTELGWCVTRHDVRGMGYSDRLVTDFSLPARARDLDAVIDQLSNGRVVLAGHDGGAALAMRYAADHPERVAALVLLNAWSSARQRYEHSHAYRTLLAIAEANSGSEDGWEFVSLATASLATGLSNSQTAQSLAHGFRRAASLNAYTAFLKAQDEVELEGELQALGMPVLIVHDRTFPLGSLDLCRHLASRVEAASLVEVFGAVEAANAVNAFLRQTAVLSADLPYPIDDLTSAPVATAPLTPRELQILRLIAAGRTNTEISDELVLSIRTVARHITNIYAKIEVRSKAEATAFALRRGLA